VSLNAFTAHPPSSLWGYAKELLNSLRRHYPDQVQRVDARSRTPSQPRGSPVYYLLNVAYCPPSSNRP